MAYSVDGKGFYGKFGGAYIPEILHKCVHDLQDAYLPIIESDGFKQEFRSLLRDYVGRPSPLYFARRMSEKYGCRLYLKREDLNHTGAHKINNAIGQALIARHMGKTHVIAETGAGQHGVATATACALLGMDCKVFMGKTDIERQHVNVERMRMLGAEVCPVTTGNMTLNDACSEAIRYWCCHPSDTFYAVGSTMGPHPYPDLVARMQSVISEELKWQLLEKTGATPRLPHSMHRRRLQRGRNNIPLCRQRAREDYPRRGRRLRNTQRPHRGDAALRHHRNTARCPDARNADRRRPDRGGVYHIGRS